MGLHKLYPTPSGRAGIIKAIAPIQDIAAIEFGCMGNLYFTDLRFQVLGIPHEDYRLYSTHFDETDVALGGLDRLERSLADVVERDNPRAVFLLPSSVPQVIGTDLDAFARQMQPRYPTVPLVCFGTGGFNVTQGEGVAEALLQVVRALAGKDAATDGGVTDAGASATVSAFNIIGSCIDLYGYLKDTAEITSLMQGAFGAVPLCVLSSECSATQIARMGTAQVNLVIRREGIAAARFLQEHFGTPYVIGRPYGVRGTADWLHVVGEVSGLSLDEDYVLARIHEARTEIQKLCDRAGSGDGSVSSALCGASGTRRISLGGHPDVVSGIREFATGEMGLSCGLCWSDDEALADAKDGIPFLDETARLSYLKDAGDDLIMASEEALLLAKRDVAFQIAYPTVSLRWKDVSLLPPLPFVGFTGAIHLASLWATQVRGG